MTREPDLQRFEQLQAELSTRRSIFHFARAVVAFVVALIFAGAAAKLFWDSERTSRLGWAAATLSAGLGLWAAWEYRTGRRLLETEVIRFESLKALRAQLGMDAPAPTRIS